VVEEVDKLVLLSEEETARGDIHFLYTIDLSQKQFKRIYDVSVNYFDNLE